MAIVRTEAFVLHWFRYGETSLICRLLTCDRGLVPVIAKGARRPKSRIGAALAPFRRLGVTYFDKPGREIQTLTEVELLAEHAGVASSLERLEAAGSWFRFLRAVVPEGVPAETLFTLAETALARLEETPAHRVDRWEAYHRAAAVEVLGLGPAIDQCSACGRELPDGGPLAFALEEGGTVCATCAAARPGSTPLASEEFALLHLYLHPDYTLLAALADGVEAEPRVRRLIRRFVAYHADTGTRAAGFRGDP